MYHFDWSVVSDYFPAMMLGLVVTLQVSAISELVGIALGLVVALCRLSNFKPLRYLAIAYIDFLRGIPVLVILLWVYYGFSILFGINFSQMQAAVIGLGCSYSAYIAEIFRSGIQAIPKGQREAGRTLGLARWQVMSHIVLPQAVRIIIPPMGNTVISMLKDSSLVAILAVSDLMRQTMVAAAETFRPFELYAAAAIIYYLLTFLSARLITFLERRLDRQPTAKAEPIGPPPSGPALAGGRGFPVGPRGGARVENVHLGLIDLGVKAHRVGVEVPCGPRLMGEIAEFVLAADEGGGIGNAAQLADIGRQIADREADAPMRAVVRLRSVNQPDVVQGHLALGQDHIDRLAFVHLDLDLLPPRQHVLLGEGVAVRQLILQMAAGHDPHAAAFHRARREGDPGGDDIGLREPPISRILMPADPLAIAGILDEEIRRPAEDVRPDHALDPVQDSGVADEIGQPAQQQMGLVIGPPADLPTLAALQGLEFFEQRPAVGTADGRQREQHAVAAVARGQVRRKQRRSSDSTPYRLPATSPIVSSRTSTMISTSVSEIT